MAQPKILIVDDEKGIRRTLAGILQDDGYHVEAAATGEEGLERLRETAPDVVLLDVLLPGMSGLEVLERVLERRNGPGPEVVMISGHSSTEMVVDAIKAGAFDFIEKPLSLEKTLLIVKNALRQKRLEEKNRLLQEAMADRESLIGESEAMQKVKEQIRQAAPSNARVLILGEHGTGKELVARRIHLLSKRAEEPFVDVNCAAIPEELIESELFGHAKGAFTGATEAKRGKFAQADRGTLFLDEVGDMSLKTQAKVLRVLEEQRIQPVGSPDSHEVDVRVLAATNKDLAEEIGQGAFREDLYFRLNVIPFSIPPLRDRSGDVPLLVRHYLERFCREYGRPVQTVTPEALKAFQAYRWPGNVRELRNIVERLAIMVPGGEIELRDLPAAVRGKPAATLDVPQEDLPLREARARFEARYIEEVLARHEGNVSRSAEILGMERSTLYRKMKAYDIET